MKFRMVHNNLNVFDLEKSMKFYRQAFGLSEVKRIVPEDGSFIIVYLGNENATHNLELTWVKEMDRPYDLGDNEIHLAFKVDDFEQAHKLHEEMGCICYENTEMGIYFVADPDGYWLEVIPENKY
ncbi:MAG: VOC family protein [Lentisphaeria bacterium]|nr:VOC family protein [Lentisphaeria bacterium]